MLVATVLGVPLGTPMLRVAVAAGPELAIAVVLNGVPAKKLEKGKVLVQPVPAMVMVPDSANTPSEFADADCVRLAVAVTVADEVDDIVPAKLPVRGANPLPAIEVEASAQGVEPVIARVPRPEATALFAGVTATVRVTTLLGRLVEVRVRLPFVSSLPVNAMSWLGEKQVLVRRIPVMPVPWPLSAPT
jgi:hypothetical protein